MVAVVNQESNRLVGTMASTAEMVKPSVRLANLKRVCADRQLSAADLAARLGSSRSYWGALLNDDNKSFGERVARRIEEGLLLPDRWLDEPHGPLGGTPGVDITIAVPRVGEPLTVYNVETKSVRSNTVSLQVMDVSASMGRGVSQPDHETVVMNMVVNESWLRRHASFSNPDNLAIVTGIGDSMRPTFEDGDPLLVDRSVTEIRLDAVYVLSLNDELFIKRIQRRPDGTVLMISDNPVYPPHPVSDGERNRFQVLGRVVMAWNSRRI